MSLSRRQTRLTALDLLGFAAADERPQQFVHMPEDELAAVLSGIKARPCQTSHFNCEEEGWRCCHCIGHLWVKLW